MNTSSITHSLLLVLAGAAILACHKENPKPSIVFEDGSMPSPVFQSTGGSHTIKFTSVLDWTASSSEEWLSLDKTSGTGGECSIKLTATASQDYEQRTAYVKLLSKSDDTTLDKTFKVVQNQKDAIITDISTAAVSWKGGDITIEVSSNVEYTVSIDASWIVESAGTKAMAEQTFAFTASKNLSAKERNALIIFKADDSSLETKVKVTQEANPDPGSGEETPFTQNCTSIGAYSGTGEESPVCTLAYSEYQYSFGSSSNTMYFRYVDFNEELMTVLSIQGLPLAIGDEYTLVTSCSDNGNIVGKRSEKLTLVYKSSEKIWFEDKNSGTGYIIPTK